MSRKFARLFVVIVLMAGIGIFWWQLPGSGGRVAAFTYQLPLTPTPEVLPNGWYRYADEHAGYAIDYPPTVHLILSRSASLEFPKLIFVLPRLTGRANQGMTLIVRRNVESSSPKQYIEQHLDNVGVLRDGVNIQPVQIGTYPAYQVEKAPFLPGLYIFSSDDKVYFFALHMDMLSGEHPTSGAQKMFFDIVSTLRILDGGK